MTDSPKKDFETLVEEYQLNWKCAKTEAMIAVMKKHPNTHRRYLEKANAR